MKKKACTLLKQIMAVLSSIAKAKSMAIKSKTSAAKARLIMFSLMKRKRLMLLGISLYNKVHSVLGQNQHDDEVDSDQSKAIVPYNAMANEAHSSSICTQMVEYSEPQFYYDDDDKYPDLTHSLFDEDLGFEDDGGSIIDIVRNSKEEGKEFKLEDEIDHVADLFIKRFRKQILLQKLESFKRHQEMLARGV